MENERKEYFLEIIKDFIHCLETNKITENDKDLYRFAMNHQLAPIIYYQTNMPSLSTAYYSSISTHVKRSKETKKILELFYNNGIEAFQIKGTIVAKYYPQPALRMMGDTDIVVNDRESARKIILDNDFDIITENKDREWQYRKNGMEFELHDRLVYAGSTSYEKLVEYFNDFQCYVKGNELDPNFHFLFNIFHLRKHFMNSGVGFRQFLDIALMENNGNELDWSWISAELQTLGLLSFAKVVFTLIEKWWDVEPPIQAVELSDDFFESATNYIFDNGVFGFNNKENEKYLAANGARLDGKSGMLKRSIAILFPSYKTLKSDETFAFINGKPYFLPLMWCYRIIRGLFRGGFKRKVQAVTDNFVTNEYIEKREELFRQWGLAE